MLNIRFVVPVAVMAVFILCACFITPTEARQNSLAQESYDPYDLARSLFKSSHVETGDKDDVKKEPTILLNEKEKDLMTRTVWAEARSQTYEGMVAVAEVILKRMKSSNQSLEKVITARKQFSCWNKKDPNLKKLKKLKKENPGYKVARKAVEDALAGSLDCSKGADHYHAKYVKPKWARGQKPVVTIGSHHFYAIKA